MTPYQKRNAELTAHVQPLPGSIPYDNLRPIRVSKRGEGLLLLDYLALILPRIDRSVWLETIEKARLRHNGELISSVSSLHLRAGDELMHLIVQRVEPDVNADITIIYEDATLFAVNKPAPLPVHPCGRFNKNTLMGILGDSFSDLALKPVHRLDANTTGVVLFAKTKAAARHLGLQFENRRTQKSYLALCRGQPEQEEFCCSLPIGVRARVGGTRTTKANEERKPALTEFRVLERSALPAAESTCLILARPITGRTNQIRIHLAALGLGIMGDTAYGRSTEPHLPMSRSDELCLHAWRLSIRHPVDGRELLLKAPVPHWAPEFGDTGAALR